MSATAMTRATCASGSNTWAIQALLCSCFSAFTLLLHRRGKCAAQADCLPEPRDVFKFLKVRPPAAPTAQPPFHTCRYPIVQQGLSMLRGRVQEHNIGQGFSLYYIAHAAYLELRGNYARADAVLQEGERRCAAAALGSTCAHSGTRACLCVPARCRSHCDCQYADAGLASMTELSGLHMGGLCVPRMAAHAAPATRAAEQPTRLLPACMHTRSFQRLVQNLGSRPE